MNSSRVILVLMSLFLAMVMSAPIINKSLAASEPIENADKSVPAIENVDDSTTTVKPISADQTPKESKPSSQEETPKEPAASSEEETPKEPAASSHEETPKEPAESSEEKAPKEPAESSQEEAPKEIVESSEEATSDTPPEATSEASEETTPAPSVVTHGLLFANDVSVSSVDRNAKISGPLLFDKENVVPVTPETPSPDSYQIRMPDEQPVNKRTQSPIPNEEDDSMTNNDV